MSERADEILRAVEEQVAARRQELQAQRDAGGGATAELPVEPAPPVDPATGAPATDGAATPPPGTYTPDLPPPPRLHLAQPPGRQAAAPREPASAPPTAPGAPRAASAAAAVEPARSPAAVPGAGELRDLASTVAAEARRLDELTSALEDAAQRMTALDGSRPSVATAAPAPSTGGSAAPAPLPPPANRILPIRPPITSPPERDAGLAPRLVAIELAVAGATRGEVALRLRSEFPATEAGPVLDDVFGVGSAEADRMPWAQR